MISERSVEIPFVMSRVGEAIDILDVGYDGNQYIGELIGLRRQLTVIDVNQRTLPAGAAFYHGDIRWTGFESESFDLIICLSTIEHIGMKAYGLVGEGASGAPDALREMERLLKRDGGRLLLTLPIGLEGITTWAGEGEFYQYSPKSFLKLLKGWAINELLAYRLSGEEYKPCGLIDLRDVPYATFRAGGVALVELQRKSTQRNDVGLDWKQAKARLDSTEESIAVIAKMPQANIMFYAGIFASLKCRFDNGERTPSLFNEIMELDG